MPIRYEEMVTWHNERRMHLTQNFFEFCAWLNVLDCLRPRRCVEIGTYRFGTAQMTLEALPGIERFVTVDINACDEHLDEAGQPYGRRLAHYGGRLAFLRANSSERTTGEKIVELLGGPPDAIFIDGNHDFNAVVTDFSLYEPLIRHGGVLGFHDCRLEGDPAKYRGATPLGSEIFWTALAAAHPQRARLLAADPGPWGHFGIGVYEKP